MSAPSAPSPAALPQAAAPRAMLALRGAALALLCLAGSVALSFPASLLATDLVTRLGLGIGPWIFRVVILACGAAGGALWGRALARAAGLDDRARGRRAAAGAALGFGLAVAVAVAALTGLETTLLAHAQEGRALPMHLAFAALFPAATGVVVLATALGLALGAARAPRAALHLAGRGALGATAAFLAVVVAMDAAGWRVGAPGAEARFTMVVVTGVGLLVATAVAGAVTLREFVTRP